MAAPTPESLIRTYWGFKDFRPLQREIISASAEGRDVVGILPTGAGKSLCFQVAGLLRGGLTLVISPLIALMHDQVAGLEKRQLRATYLNSTLDHRTLEERLRNLQQGQYQFLYLSPEWLHNERFREQAKRFDIRLLVVDEAHCVSQWGYDFRPNYLRIQVAKQWLPKVPTLAVTATATPLVREDMVALLGLKAPATFVHSFARPNLRYSVLYEEDRQGKLLEMLDKVKGTALVYVRSRKATGQLAEILRENGIDAGAYHAGIPPETRAKLQAAWQASRLRVLVATNAFGMGIDKPDVRLVVHWDIPPDLESYYQEAGRAGRDGQVAFCVLLYAGHALKKAQQRIGERYPSYDALVAVYQTLARTHKLAADAYDPEALHPFDPAQLAEKLGVSLGSVLACLRVLQQQQLLHVLGDIQPKARLRFTTSPGNLRNFRDGHPKFEALIDGLLRVAGGEAFAQIVTYEPAKLGAQTGLDAKTLEAQLAYLTQLDLLRHEGAKRQHYLRYLRPRVDPSPAVLGWNSQEQLRGLAEQRLHALTSYATETNTCRQVLLCRYFGEELPALCGKCDVCSGRHKTQKSPTKGWQQLEAEILEKLNDGPQGYGELLSTLTAGTARERPIAINRLIEAGKVRRTHGFLLEKTTS